MNDTEWFAEHWGMQAMTDRLAEIEQAIRDGRFLAAGVVTVIDSEKVDWLIAEVKRLRALRLSTP